MKYQHVARALTDRPWFTTPEHLGTIGEVVRYRMEHGRLDESEIVARLEAASAAAGTRAGGRRTGTVALIPVYGTIFPRANLFTMMSGGATVDGLRAAFREAMADDTVASVVMEFDSPGGQVDGIEELATEIREARGRKPIVAIANSLMASAAYYLASQADEIVATPSSIVGSIGVVTYHQDFSRQLEMEGVAPTIIAMPPAKAEGSPMVPLSDEARTHIEQMVGDYYGQFVATVAKGRGVSAETVRRDYGGGRVLTAKRAQQAGMVDRIDTLDETLRRAATGRIPQRTGARAEAIAALLDVPVEHLPAETVGMVEQQAAAQDGLATPEPVTLGIGAAFELERDRWLLNS
jgi:capsid assembly protease